MRNEHLEEADTRPVNLDVVGLQSRMGEIKNKSYCDRMNIRQGGQL